MQGAIRQGMLLLIAGVFATSAMAVAAEIRREGPRLRVNGPLASEGFEQFATELASGSVRVVVLEDSNGATAEVAEDYARAVRTAGVATEAHGLCAGACAFVFLAGRERLFGDDAQVDSLLVPTVARPDTGEVVEFAPAAGATEAAASAAEAAQRPLVPASLKADWQPWRGLLFSARPTLFGRVHTSHWCDGSQGTDIARCEALKEFDPFQLKVLTGR